MLSVGEILKKQRELLGIELSDVEKKIKVRAKFIQAIEKNDWSSFSSKVYITGLIKSYSEFLGLDSKRTTAFFRRDYEWLEDVRFKKKVSGKYLTSETKKITTFALIVLFIIFFGYFGYQLKLYFAPPKLTIQSPETDRFTKEDKIKIIGKTEKDAEITILGDRIYQNKEGIFEYEFPLHKGENLLSIEVIGANGKKTTVNKIYFRKE